MDYTGVSTHQLIKKLIDNTKRIIERFEVENFNHKSSLSYFSDQK